MEMHLSSPFRLTTLVLSATLGLSACGSSDNGTEQKNNASTNNPDTASNNDTAPPVTTAAYGVFEIHYVTGATSSESYSEVSGKLQDAEPANRVVWTKKATEGSCSLLQPEIPFCNDCP